MTNPVILLRRMLAAMIAVALSCGISRAFECGAHAAALRADRLEAKLVLITPDQGGHELVAAAKPGSSKPGQAANVDSTAEHALEIWGHAISAPPERAIRPRHPQWISTIELRL